MNRTLNILVVTLMLILTVIVVNERYVQRLFARISHERQTADHQVWNTVFWNQRKAYFEKLDCTGRIVFLGTSMVAENDWNELLRRTDISNRSIGGDVTAGILRRVGLYAAQHPKAIFLKAGVNDIFWKVPMDSVKENYTKIIQQIRNYSVPLYIMATNFTSDKFEDHGRINKEVEMLNSFLKAVCLKDEIPFIDINAGLLRNGILDNAFTYDGIHLNGDGYFRVAKRLQPYLP